MVRLWRPRPFGWRHFSIDGSMKNRRKFRHLQRRMRRDQKRWFKRRRRPGRSLQVVVGVALVLLVGTILLLRGQRRRSAADSARLAKIKAFLTAAGPALFQKNRANPPL